MKINKMIFFLYSVSFLSAQFPVHQINSIHPSEGDEFGTDVSISGDKIAISSPRNNDNGIHSGSVEVYSVADGVWIHDAKIHGSDASFFDHFGYSISLEGSTLAVGAPNHNAKGSRSGAVYIFEHSSEFGWVEKQKLIPDDLSGGYQFGFNIDIEQNYLAIGAHGGLGNNTDYTGSVYMYKKENDTWILDGEKIIPNDGASGDRFGYSLSLSQSDKLYLLVGAYQHDNRKGASYLFAKQLETYFVNEDKIKPQVDKYLSRKAVEPKQVNKFLSREVSEQKIKTKKIKTKKIKKFDTVHYTRVQDSDTWEQIHKFQPADVHKGATFGYSVSIDGDNLIIGSPMSSSDPHQTGVVYLYQKNNDTWSLINIIQSAKLNKFDHFGINVHIESTNIFIGAAFYDTDLTNAGAIFAYRYLDNDLQESNLILPLNEYDHNYYGLAFDAHNQLFISGSMHDSSELDGPSLFRSSANRESAGAAFVHWPNLEINPWGTPLDSLEYGNIGRDTLEVNNFSNAAIGLSVSSDNADFIQFETINFVIEGNSSITIPMVIDGNNAVLGNNSTNINLDWSESSVPNHQYSYNIYVVDQLDIVDFALPKVFALGDNYPNPFNPRTTIKYDIPSFSRVSIKVFDIMGREVVSLVDRNIGPGYYSVVWDGAKYSSGLYFAQMIAGTYVTTKKLMLIK